MKTKSIAVINQKGGSGKSTLTMLIALALASNKSRVLVIDCDPQGGLSSFLVDPADNNPGLFDFLGKFKKFKEVIYSVSRGGIAFDLIPADYRLDSISSGLDPFALKRALKDVKDYDYIVLDNPPTVQGISRAAAIFADKIIIPAEISAPALGPTIYTLKSLEEIEKQGRVLLIGYKEPKENGGGYTADLTRKFNTELGDAVAGSIPRNVATAKAVADPDTVWTDAKIEKLLKPLGDIVEAI